MLKLGTAVAALAIACAPAANAAITWNAQLGLGTPQPGDVVIDFDSPLPSGVSLGFTGDGGIYQGSSTTFAAPYGDATHYLSSGIGSASLTFAQPQRSVGLDWSSVDLYNTLQLFDGSTLVGTLTGGQVEAGANGSRGPDGTYNVHIEVAAAQNWNTLVASSTQYAFELDNVATHAASNVPEPTTLAIMGMGMAGLGFVTRKRKVSEARG